jgi:hypothetical protein
MESLADVCGYYKKKAGHKHKDCLVRKTRQSGPGTGSEMKCSLCGKTGHSGDDCCKKHPEKAPHWFKDMTKKGKTAWSSVDIVLASVETINDNDLLWPKPGKGLWRVDMVCQGKFY